MWAYFCSYFFNFYVNTTVMIEYAITLIAVAKKLVYV
jgi:hypothetical protein